MTTSVSKPTIWITGGSGFVGKRLIQYFSSLGHEVTSLSRRDCPLADVSVTVDLSKSDAQEKLADLILTRGRPEVIIHAASKQPGIGGISEFVSANVQATANLLQAVKETPPLQIIYTSTQSVYQRPASLPVKETAAARGTLPYGATKRWAEQLMENFREHSRIVVLRLPSLYGAGQSDSFIDGLAQPALRGESLELFSRGELIRDALHVDDVVKGIAACVDQQPQSTFSLLNLGCGRPITTLEYAKVLVQALGSESKIVPIDRQASHFDLYADIDEARRQIGFEPLPLEQSMKRYADEIRA
jgi:nucleoside-diphosphate-sugar epimerase